MIKEKKKMRKQNDPQNLRGLQIVFKSGKNQKMVKPTRVKLDNGAESAGIG